MKNNEKNENQNDKENKKEKDDEKKNEKTTKKWKNNEEITSPNISSVWLPGDLLSLW